MHSVSQIQYIYIVCGVTTATFPLYAAFHVQININFAVVDLILEALVKHMNVRWCEEDAAMIITSMEDFLIELAVVRLLYETEQIKNKLSHHFISKHSYDFD